VTAVLDASAVLALIYREPGHERVAEQLNGAVVSAVNWSEVVQKLMQLSHPAPRNAAEAIRSLGVDVEPFHPDAAVETAELWPRTRAAGLSLGDRACLATARLLNATAVTADQTWSRVDAGVDVELIR
jgi:ribonuclease VapC